MRSWRLCLPVSWRRCASEAAGKGVAVTEIGMIQAGVGDPECSIDTETRLHSRVLRLAISSKERGRLHA